MTWTRLARALGSDHNPLRRRSDLIAAWLTPAAIAIFLALGPLVAVGAIAAAHAGVTTARQAGRDLHPGPAALLQAVPGRPRGDPPARQAGRDLHPVPAVLLQAVPGPLMTAGGTNSWVTWAPAR